MHTSFLRLGSFAALLLCSCLTATSDSLSLANGTQSNTLFVVTSAGRCFVPPGVSMAWPVDSVGATCGVDGTTNLQLAPAPGHDYQIVACLTNAATGPSVQVFDQSPSQTYWFWLGMAMSLAMGFGALGSKWVRRVNE